MIRFHSANTRVVNPRRAMQEALEVAFDGREVRAGLLLVYAAVGHDVAQLSDIARQLVPGMTVLAASCAGVIGREGPGETMRDIAVMALEGEGYVTAHVDEVYGPNAFERGAELARQLLGTPAPVRMIYLLASGIDMANDRLIQGIESVLGADVVIFGATSSDQMQGVATHQAVNGVRFQHAAFAVAIWDPTLTVDTQATHGFVAVGEPMVVTAARENRILELDGQPAWPRFLQRLALPPTGTLADTIPIGALAEELPAAEAAEYGNPHILRVVTQHGAQGELVYATTCREGTRLWLTDRDEARIFGDMDRMMTSMVARSAGRTPVAVFQADCLARGRRLFDRVMKEELVQRMQAPLAGPGGVPPWFGVYGFGEYARLGGRNAYHNYTTALAALYRTGG